MHHCNRVQVQVRLTLPKKGPKSDPSEAFALIGGVWSERWLAREKCDGRKQTERIVALVFTQCCNTQGVEEILSLARRRKGSFVRGRAVLGQKAGRPLSFFFSAGPFLRKRQTL